MSTDLALEASTITDNPVCRMASEAEGLAEVETAAKTPAPAQLARRLDLCVARNLGKPPRLFQRELGICHPCGFVAAMGQIEC
jgi:hypothetical protein